jgi:hypothetical protein
MPEISRFFGIVIAIFYNDHPPPHFHVRYGAQRAILDIESMLVIGGTLTPRLRGPVVEGVAQHQGELQGIVSWHVVRCH